MQLVYAITGKASQCNGHGEGSSTHTTIISGAGIFSSRQQAEEWLKWAKEQKFPPDGMDYYLWSPTSWEVTALDLKPLPTKGCRCTNCGYPAGTPVAANGKDIQNFKGALVVCVKCFEMMMGEGERGDRLRPLTPAERHHMLCTRTSEMVKVFLMSYIGREADRNAQN